MDSPPSLWLEDIQRWAMGVPEVAAVWLYGSRATGAHTADSDLDIAYELAGKTHRERAGVWTACVERWPRPVLSQEVGGHVFPKIHLKWFDPELHDVVATGVERDGILIWRRQ